MIVPAPMRALTSDRDLRTFIARELRLPRLGDPVVPWRYRGWLLSYVILAHEFCPALADRWGYHLRTIEAGKLLDEPIPQIHFGAPDLKVFGLLTDWSKLIGRDCGGWSDFRLMLDWLCWGLSVSKDEPHVDDAINEKLYRQVDMGPLLATPYDYLGAYVAQGKARGWNPTGFYPTPHAVVECMVRMQMHDVDENSRDPRLRTVSDPCVGSGRMLLHASNLSLKLSGQDIDSLAVAMCLINGALYAPWLSFPLPDDIFGVDSPQDRVSMSGARPPDSGGPPSAVTTPISGHTAC
jgi:N-6 DNA Methylase